MYTTRLVPDALQGCPDYRLGVRRQPELDTWAEKHVELILSVSESAARRLCWFVHRVQVQHN